MATIGLDGQYHLSIDKVSFSEEDFINIKIFEYAGLQLPQAILIFSTSDAEMRATLHAGKIINISLSASENDGNVPLQFKVVDTDSSPQGDGEYVIKVTLEQALEGITSTSVSKSYLGTSPSVIEELCREFVHVDNQARGASDSQAWVRPMQTARDFIRAVWLRSKLTASTLLMSFNIDGELRLRDTKSLMKRSADYDYRTLSSITDEERDIGILGSVNERSASGLLSHVAAAGRKMYTYDPSTGENVLLQADTHLSFLASRGTLETGTRNITAMQQSFTDNVHSGFEQALLDNKANLARLSTVEVPIFTTGRYIPIHPLDIVMHLEPSSSSSESVDAGSGLYVVAKVIREIGRKTLDTTIILNRESRNGD